MTSTPGSFRPSCYPEPSLTVLSSGAPLLDVLTSPVPSGLFQSPTDWRHVLCIHLGQPVPVSYGGANHERRGLRIQGQFCVVPAGTSTRWIVSRPTRSLLLRLSPALLDVELAPSIHIRDAHVERIGWIMQAEAREDHPGGTLFADSLASALAVRLLHLQSRRTAAPPRQQLPAWQLRRVVEYIEAHIATDLRLMDLARVAGYSVSHFKRLFTRATGTPVHRFVLERRVERARDLLLRGHMTVTEVAFETGFSHLSHLTRSMKRILGYNPSELRHRPQLQRSLHQKPPTVVDRPFIPDLDRR